MAPPPDGPRDAGLPIGSRDVLPTETAELREAEDRLLRSFEAFGYREVRTPALELDSVIDRAEGEDPAYRLFDDRGQVLTLRPDPTIPVARLVATRLADAPDPVRVCYFGTAYRPPAAGRADEVEVRQAGVELVGAAGAAADAEVVAVLRGALAVSELRGFRIVLGSVALVTDALAGAGLDEAARAPLLRALRERDHVAWRALALRAPVDEALREAIVALPTLRAAAALGELASRIPGARAAAEALLATLEAVARHGAAEEVALDAGVVPSREYYSGITIEAYAEGVGAPIAVGGRYDGLAARFGRDRPAVGVAVDVSRLHRASVWAGGAEGPRRSGVVLVDGLRSGVEQAAAARAAGLPVAAAGADVDAARELARAEGLGFVARPDGDGFLVEDIERGDRFAVADLPELAGRRP